jgi:hypothetical protein
VTKSTLSSGLSYAPSRPPESLSEWLGASRPKDPSAELQLPAWRTRHPPHSALPSPSCCSGPSDRTGRPHSHRVFFHRQGEIRDRTFENQGFRASGLSLITAAIVHWNTVYLHRAVQHSRALGAAIPDDLLAHVAPLGWEHIALTGDYVWTNSNRRTRLQASTRCSLRVPGPGCLAYDFVQIVW